MLPITRATVGNFCIVCLQVLQPSEAKKHELQKDAQLLRVFNAMAKEKLINLAIPKQLCHCCYTKLFMFCKFAETSICSSNALNMLMEGENENKEIIESNLHRICTMCFKLKSDKSTILLNHTELQELLQLIFLGMDNQRERFVQPKNICVLCSQKSKTFVEFQKRLQESQQYFISIFCNADDLTEVSNRIQTEQTTDKCPKQADIFGSDSEPEIDNIIASAANEKSDPFDLNVSSIDTSFHRCEKCNRSFRKLSAYEVHKCRAISATNVIDKVQDVFSCNICQKDYKTKILLRTHNYRVHCKANKKCPYCQREFKQQHHLNDHIRLVHEGVRPYKCSYCAKSFGLPKTLRVHLMGHTNERPFQCDICAKAFRQKSELNRHIKNHSADMQFRCPVCSQGKSSQEELDEHLTHHNNRDGYQCSKCGRKFTKLCHLKNHDDAVHLKLRPFKCDYSDCGKAFAARKTLQMHQLTHTGDCSSICNVCHKEFSCKANLLRHFYMHKTIVKQETDG